jgi:hypothetical protein
MSLHRELLEVADEEEIDPERKKNQKEVENLIKKLEASAKAPKKKKSYEMDLGEADAALQEEQFQSILSLTEKEISDDEFERLQAVFKRMGGKIVQGGKSSKDSMVVQFPSSKLKDAREIKKGLERRSRQIQITIRKDGNKIFMTMRGDR